MIYIVLCNTGLNSLVKYFCITILLKQLDLTSKFYAYKRATYTLLGSELAPYIKAPLSFKVDNNV